MPRARVLLAVLFVAAALLVALIRPGLGRADESPAPAVPNPPPAPTTTDPVPPAHPAVRATHSRRLQHHLSAGARIVQYAKRFRGVRYVWGGSSPRSGFDCSGFVRFVYSHFGVSLAHSSYAQFGSGRGISRRWLRPGDLVFFHGLGHVGIYVGHGRFIHAPHSGTRVRIESMTGWYSSRFDGARRLRAT
jgi:cell wall-associated NlpC family hydrolase